MSESQPPPSELETYQLEGRSLNDWHRWLTTDFNGKPAGHLRTPGSRYGRNSDDCAWWALAAEVVYIEANGPDDVEAGLDGLMGLAVNDHDDIGTLVYDYWHVIPPALQAMLDVRDDVRRLL